MAIFKMNVLKTSVIVDRTEIEVVADNVEQAKEKAVQICVDADNDPKGEEEVIDWEAVSTEEVYYDAEEMKVEELNENHLYVE